MTLRYLRLLAIGLLAVVVLGWAVPSSAQNYTGRIDITVVDTTGARLPGVTLELSGPFTQTTVSDGQGLARFLNLAPGTYSVKATLQGFAEFKSPSLPVVAGASVPLTVKMGVAGAKQEVTVTAEAPTIDTKKQGTSTSVGIDELQNVPTARDPWVVMQSVPGVVMDRVNVGGSESGQQAGFVGKGAGSGQATWNVDGMPLTDMSSLSSPFYYDFDMFSEMNVSTGGADAKSSTGGVQLNFMLKSGTNNFHGNGKFYFENESMQGTNIDAATATALGSPTGKGPRTNMFRDYGGDVGGPIVKDRLWFWGAYGNQDIHIITLQGTDDETFLKNISFKTQGQISNSLRGSFTFFQADKSKFGRGTGWTAFNQGATYDQGGFGGPNRMYKGELNWVAGDNFFLVGRYAHLKGGFQLLPHGGVNTPAWFDANAQLHDSYGAYITNRPQDMFVADGNYFFKNHEIKFGFSWKQADVHSTSTYANDSITDAYGAAYGIPVFNATGGTYAGYPYMSVAVNAPYASDVSGKYMNFYLGDTITLKKATINIGVRYDRQTSSVLPSTEAAPAAPFNSVLPAITAPGVNDALVFGILQPRVGITYSLGENNKTQLRGTYAMFTDQIGSGAAGFLSVAQYRGFYVTALDANGDHVAQPSEIMMSTYQSYINDGDYWGYDPANPSAVSSSIHKVGTYGNPKTHEVIFGVDHELLPNFGFSASYTWRRIGSQNWRPIQCTSCTTGYITGANYTYKGSVTGALPSGVDGSPAGNYVVPYYGLSTGVVYPGNKGTIYTARPDYHQIFQGLEFSATKRMSNRWMARFGFSTNSWREYFDSNLGQGNPTPIKGAPNVDGGLVVIQSGGSGKSNIFMVQPKYQIIANGAYQLPYDIDLGFSYLLRQGYPMPWVRSTSGGFSDTLGSTKNLLLVNPVDYAKLPTVQTMDFRIGKRIKFAHGMAVAVDFDIFNLFNFNTIMQRQYSFTAGNYTAPLEYMQPRIARLGVRFTF